APRRRAEPGVVSRERALFLQLRLLGNFQPPASPDMFRRRGHCDLEHSIFELGLGLVGDSAVGKRNQPVEASIAAFGMIQAFPLLLVFPLPLASNRDAVLGDVHSHIVLLEAGKVRSHDELVIPMKHLDVGRRIGSLRVKYRSSRGTTSVRLSAIAYYFLFGRALAVVVV